MGLDVTTKTVQNVIDHVERLFGDESGAQLTQTDIINWINTGQLEIVKENKVLKDSVTTVIVAGTSSFEFASNNVLTIEALFYDGAPLKYLSFNDFNETILNQQYSPTETGRPTIFYEWGDTLYIWPVPDTAEAGKILQLYYIKHPANISVVGDLLSIPDIYFDTLVNYVLAKAYEMDDNLIASMFKRNEMSTQLSKTVEREAGQFKGYYPTITILPEDA